MGHQSKYQFLVEFEISNVGVKRSKFENLPYLFKENAREVSQRIQGYTVMTSTRPPASSSTKQFDIWKVVRDSNDMSSVVT
jgi:hypothetical protein